MKRFVMMALLCTFVLGLATTAAAADIKASGDYTFEAYWQSNMGLDEDRDDERPQSYNVLQRLRTKFQFIANENLKGVLYTEAGTSTWGQDELAITASSANVFELKQGYIDFNWPGTEVNARVGYQALSLPSAVDLNGGMILNDEVAAATIGGPITENISYLVGYARGGQSDAHLGQQDVYFAVAPMSFDNIKVSPFFAYANLGESVDNGTVFSGGRAFASGLANDELDGAWWAGVAFEGTFADFVTKADFNYGTVDAEDDAQKMSGWLFDASVAYTGWEEYVTPELFFVYTSGEDGNSSDSGGESERMPTLAADWAISSFYTDGNWGLSSAIAGNDPNLLGFWALGLAMNDFSFMEDLTHTARIIYYTGTNDEDWADDVNFADYKNVAYGNTLTEEDHVWEVNFDSQYKIYDELTGYVELGWVNADLDEDIWGDDAGGDAYKLSMGMNYSF
ncbi:outer membrane homotrimeric porin [Desulfovibrio oxyclinae]|uniref:outer membrane homotrimeric porin n=1 Tax=Desulfovibrio oxyclinae TaxID=63560 RepID=UPI00035E41A5|nr:outer membrane homotrimeric porin [Desulfovibrio oxyclinae]